MKKQNKEFNLSEKRQDRKHPNPKLPFNNRFTYPEEDVKEFIKRLKDWVYKMDFVEGYFCGEEGEAMRNQIDKFAGEKLI